ncbi:hypothetical protein F8388_006855, partial [Cannabis sativa]
VGVGIRLALPKQILYQSFLKPSAIATHGEQQQSVSVSQIDQCSEIATKDSTSLHRTAQHNTAQHTEKEQNE